MDVSLFSSYSHMTIKTRKVDPRSEGGAGILIKESSIKAIEKCRDESSLEKSSTDRKDHLKKMLNDRNHFNEAF